MRRKKRFSTQDIYESLRRMITEFEILPGARVTEHELADRFKVSRTPVREALHRLETEGLLSIRPKQGCFIRQVDVEEISQYYDVRVGLESMAIELACENMTDEALHELAEFWDPGSRPESYDYPDQIKEVEESFHAILAEKSGNPVLARYLRDVNDHIRVLRRLGFPDKQSIEDTYAEHYAICQLLLKRDAKGAKEAMSVHIRKSQRIAKTVTLLQLQQRMRRVAKARQPAGKTYSAKSR